MAGGGHGKRGRPQKLEMEPPKPPKPEPLAESAEHVFDQFPHIELILSRHGKTMSISYLKTITSIGEEAIKKNAQYNNDQDLFLRKESIGPAPAGVDPYRTKMLPIVPSAPPSFMYIIPMLPKHGAFVLVVRIGGYPDAYQQNLAGEFILDNGRPIKEPPLKILFRFSDLYLMGYLSRNMQKWRICNDMDITLKGLISEINIDEYTVPLHFSSSYTGAHSLDVNFNTLKVGGEQLFLARLVLLNDTNRTEREIRVSMAVYCVTISEGSRRRFMCLKVIKTLKSEKSEEVDLPSEQSTQPLYPLTNQEAAPRRRCEKQTSDRFHSWVQDCEKVKSGFSPSRPNLTTEEFNVEMTEHIGTCFDITLAKLKE